MQTLSTSTANGQQLQFNNDYQFCDENNALTAALGQLLSTTSQNSTDEMRVAENDNKVSIVSAPKNVKFIIPLGRSGITSNESTFGVIESTTRTITHVKDIFPLNPISQSQINTEEHQQEMTKSDSEEIPLLSNENSNEK
jgi:hypothetical protein